MSMIDCLVSRYTVPRKFSGMDNCTTEPFGFDNTALVASIKGYTHSKHCMLQTSQASRRYTHSKARDATDIQVTVKVVTACAPQKQALHRQRNKGQNTMSPGRAAH